MGLPVAIKVAMHVFSSGSVMVVNAEVDSTGGVVKGGTGVGKRTSPRRAAIEKVQADLRQGYNLREERRRELEFLEKGGDPLEFKLRFADSPSVQSMSVTDQQPDQLVTSEGKGSIARTASHGDSVESSGKPGAHPLVEPNCADNLLLFTGENEVALLRPSKSSSTPSEQSTQLDGLVNAKDLKDSMTCSLMRNSYKRRSRPNRNGARTITSDVVLLHGGLDLCSRHASGDVEGIVPFAENPKDQNVSVNCNSTPPSPNRGTVCKSSDDQLQLDTKNEADSSADRFQGLSEGASVANAFKVLTKYYDNGQTAVIDQRGVDIVSEDLECPRAKCLYPCDFECEPHVATTKLEDQANCRQTDRTNGSKDDEESIQGYICSSKMEVATKLLDSISSWTCMNRNIDNCVDNEMLTNQKRFDLIENVEKQTLVSEVTFNKEEAAELEEEKKETQPSDNNDFTYRNSQGNGFVSLSNDELNRNALENEAKDQVALESVQADGDSEREKNYGSRKTYISVSHTGTTPLLKNLRESSILEFPKHPPSVKGTEVTAETKENNVTAISKYDENAILKEAHMIQAKCKKMSELNVTIFPVENRKRYHWNYVLEEMAWLANDFAQERLWKMTAASQLCHQVAQLTCQEKHSHREKKKVARLLSKAVMSFWSSIQKANKGMDLTRQNSPSFTIQEYAERFIKSNSYNVLHNQSTPPATTNRVTDLGTVDMSQESYWTEGSLFFPVPSNAMEAYRKVIESHIVQYEKSGNSLQEGETSACDVTDFQLIENGFEEAGEETSMHDYDFGKSSKLAQKKQRMVTGYGMESYNVGADLMHTQFFENKLGTQQSVLVGKRPAINVSIPTKRVRTAPRQRVLSPYAAGTSGCAPFASNTEASSADASPFQEDLDGGPIIPNSFKVESCGDFRKSLPFESAEIHMLKRRKKGSAHEQKWQVDSNIYSEQRDQPRKRPESHPLESNGLFGQHVLKKPKVMRSSALDSSFDNIGPDGGSIPCPMTSKMNMSNSNELFKILGGGGRSRKAKFSQVPTRQQGSGTHWSLFEDQALVVLAHDMGPNWELVSDALTSTLQFKCIYRNPKECKERHKILMDKTTSDGVDSADELGSTQPYPSTLPGIPKGSARQLFQRLLGPIEEDTLKSHFEKIIVIVQKQHNRKNVNHDPKQLLQPHSSHMLALSQVHPNNLSGEAVLIPLDFCDSITSSPDILSVEFQSSHNNGPPMINQCPGAPILPASGISPTLMGDRYAVSQSAPLSTDEQKKMQQYNQMGPARNILKQTPSGPGYIPGSDRGLHALPGNCATGMIRGVNRSLPVPGLGLQVVASPQLNSGSMLSTGVASIPSPIHNMHSGPGTGHGNSVIRPRGALHMMQPSQKQETQSQILAPELQMQVSQAGNQGVPPCGGLSSSCSNRRSLQPHLLGHQPCIQATNQASNTKQQAYALHLAKERQLQQRFLQQQHQFAASDALLPHVQPQAQFPVASPVSNNQVQSQASSPPISFSPVSSCSAPSVMHKKHQISPHGLVRNSQASGSGLKTQVAKQRRLPQQQRQPHRLQQAGRKHPQQRQQSQSQQQTDHVKGVGRGNTTIQQSTSVGSPLNGLSTTLGNQSRERGQQAMHLVQQQSLYSGSALNPVQNSKELVSPNPSTPTQPQQMLHRGQGAPPSKKVQQIPYTSQLDDTPEPSANRQSVSSLVAASSSHQQPSGHHKVQVQSHQKSVSQNSPTTERVQQPSCNVHSEMTKQIREPQNEQHHVSNTDHTHHPEIVMLEACNYSTNGLQVVSPCDDQLITSLNAPELLGDSIKSVLPLNLASCETQLACVSSEPTEVLHQKQSFGGPDPIKYEVNEQSKKSPPLQKPPSPASQHPQ